MKTKSLVEAIFSQPTAPFREGWVLQKIIQILEKSKTPFFEDDFGNIIAGCKNAAAAKKARIALMAHTDHPGFHVVSQNKKNVSALWFGGAPFKTMKGAKVRIHNPMDPSLQATGRITYISKNLTHHEGIETKIKLDREVKLNNTCFGAFDFPGVEFKKDRIITRCADDLAGVVIALGTVLNLKNKNVIAVLTRAEEVGFVGCLAMMNKKTLSHQTAIISLEASRTLEGAFIGEGPVLRLGDRTTLFHTDLTNQMWSVAQALQKKKKNFKYQRRIMDGGSCEATALGIYGYVTSGLSVPLGNYHNQGPKGPGPEIVSLNDIEWARQFCTEFAKSYKSPRAWTKNIQVRLEKELRHLTPKLNQPKLSVFESKL